MTKSTKTKQLAANVPVPQSREEAQQFLYQIGVRNRDLARVETFMNDQIAEIKKTTEANVLPLRDEVTALTDGLKIWCEANRLAITDGGKTKTADLGTGRISWRARPPKVSLRDSEAIIASIISLGFRRLFLREKIEVNRDAMLANAEKARTIPGVTIGSAGEDFVVEPFEAELGSAA